MKQWIAAPSGWFVLEEGVYTISCFTLNVVTYLENLNLKNPPYR